MLSASPLVAVRVVRELGCPGKIVRSSRDPGVARFELAEPLRAGMQRATLRSSYVLHARGAGMSRIPVDSQHIHSRRPLAREPSRMDLNRDKPLFAAFNSVFNDEDSHTQRLTQLCSTLCST